jgi:hypothetical protein
MADWNLLRFNSKACPVHYAIWLICGATMMTISADQLTVSS